MKVVRFHDAERYEPEKDWQRVSLCSEPDVSIEHFIKPPRHASPSHKHPNAQVLVVLKGRLTITPVGGDEQIVAEGDAAYIPGNEEHVVRNELDEPSIGLDIFVPGRSFDFWLKRKQQ
jgi:quercetin dioxygenase-like cupin family protein